MSIHSNYLLNFDFLYDETKLCVNKYVVNQTGIANIAPPNNIGKKIS